MKNKKKILISASPFCEHSLLPVKMLKENKIDYDLNPQKRKLTEKEILNLIKSYDGLIADVEPLNKKVLLKAKNHHMILLNLIFLFLLIFCFEDLNHNQFYFP